MSEEIKLFNGQIVKTIENNVIKPTWVIHGVVDKLEANGIVYHTHGMGRYDSLELELNLPLSLKDACRLLNSIGLKIANGRKFKENEKIKGVLMCSFMLKRMKGICKTDVDILRVLIPDEYEHYPWDKDCEDVYNKQLS